MKKPAVLFDCEDFVIIDKPAGMSVHNDKQSVQRFFPDFFTAHRIDKETSGILLLGKNKLAADSLSQLFESQEIQKTYVAVVYGNKHKLKGKTGEWSQDLSAKPGGFSDIKGPKPYIDAISKVKILKQNDYFSLLELSPKTGRTHQLRKHCALNFSPIVGDGRYGKKQSNQRIEKLYGSKNMYLHAKEIRFYWYGSELVIKSELPSSYSKLIQ